MKEGFQTNLQHEADVRDVKCKIPFLMGNLHEVENLMILLTNYI